MVKADAVALDKLLADDLSYTHSSAKMETKADVIKGVTSGTSKNLAVEFKTTKVRQFGTTVITYHEMVFAHPGVTNKVYVTMVWAKQPAGWQLVQRQATSSSARYNSSPQAGQLAGNFIGCSLPVRSSCNAFTI